MTVTHRWRKEPGSRVQGSRPLDELKVQAPCVVRVPEGGYRIFYTAIGPAKPYATCQGYILIQTQQTRGSARTLPLRRSRRIWQDIDPGSIRHTPATDSIGSGLAASSRVAATTAKNWMQYTRKICLWSKLKTVSIACTTPHAIATETGESRALSVVVRSAHQTFRSPSE